MSESESPPMQPTPQVRRPQALQFIELWRHRPPGLTQGDFAERAGVSQQEISRAHRGLVSNKMYGQLLPLLEELQRPTNK